jgi:putative spermidine/putrescine transport system permease protein
MSLLASASDGTATFQGPRTPWNRAANSAWLLLLPALIILVPAYIVPVSGLLLNSFGAQGWTLANYGEALGSEAYIRILYRTVVLSAQVTTLTLVLGYPIAYMIAKSPAHRQKWLMVLLAMPLWTSALVRSFAWIVLLGRQGIVNDIGIAIGLQDQPTQLLYGRVAVLIGLVHVMLPYSVFPLVSIMRRIPAGLSFTGMSLGASRTASFWLIFFPLSLPGVASGLVLTFVLTMGYFVTPALLGGLRETTYVMLIQQQVEQAVNWPLASAMAVILLTVTLSVVALFYRFLRLQDEAVGPRSYSSRGGWLLTFAATAFGKCNAFLLRRASHRAAAAARTAPVQGSSLPIQLLSWTIIAFIIIPILILLPLSLSGASFLKFPPSSLSLRWYINYFSRPDWVSATITSFEVALPALVIATCVGTAAAIASSRLKGRALWSIRGLLISPLIIPHILIGISIYFVFARLRLIGSIPGLILAHCVIALPVVVVIVEGALRRANIGPERAARSLGAGPIRAFMSTTFVAIRPSIITAALFAFLTSFDDVVIALFISGTNSTLPKRMWEGVSFEIDPTISAASTLLVLLSIAVVLTVDLVGRRVRVREAAALPTPV